MTVVICCIVVLMRELISRYCTLRPTSYLIPCRHLPDTKKDKPYRINL